MRYVKRNEIASFHGRAEPRSGVHPGTKEPAPWDLRSLELASSRASWRSGLAFAGGYGASTTSKCAVARRAKVDAPEGEI